MAVPRRYAHILFGVIQAGLTSAVASGVAVMAGPGAAPVLQRWLSAWFLSWAMMLPVVVFAAPFIRRAVEALTAD